MKTRNANRTKYPRAHKAPRDGGWSAYAARKPRSAAVPTTAAALLWPWLTSPPPPVGGTVVGTLASGALFRYDAHQWYQDSYTSAMNAVLLGVTGSGKTNTAFAMILRGLAQAGRKAVVVDGKTTWAEVGLHYGATVVRFDDNSAINLLEVPPGTPPNQARDVRWRAVRAIVELAADRALTDREVWALETAVTELQGHAPLLRDLAQLVIDPPPNSAVGFGGQEELKNAGATLLPPFGRLTGGRSALAALLDRPSTVTFDKAAELFVVSLGDLTLADDLRNAAMCAIGGWIDAAVVGNTEPRTLILDEAWQFLKQPAAATAHAERLRLARQNNLANLLIVHRPQDFASYGEAGSAQRAAVESILALSDAVVTGRLDHNDAQYLAKILNLNTKEPELITGHPQGRFLWSVQTVEHGRKSWVVQTNRTPWEAAAWHTKAPIADASQELNPATTPRFKEPPR